MIYYLEVYQCNALYNVNITYHLRSVSTQENKHRIGLDLFPSKNLRVADHKFKLKQKIGTESPCPILFRSHAYFPEWKSAISIICVVLGSCGYLEGIR